jgi:hypothetical protein
LQQQTKPNQTKPKNKMKAIKLLKTQKIESAASKDSNRPAICSPFIRDGRLVATDGKILASIPIEGIEPEDQTELEGKKLPIEALKAARKVGGNREENSRLNVTDDNRCEVAGGASFPLPELLPEAPKVAEIVLARKHPDEDDAFAVTLDVALIAKLSEALGDQNITFIFTKGEPLRMVTMLPESRNGAFGLIMPRRTR